MTQPIDTAGLAGHIDLAAECRDYLAHEVMDQGDPTGRLGEFVESLGVVLNALDTARAEVAQLKAEMTTECIRADRNWTSFVRARDEREQAETTAAHLKTERDEAREIARQAVALARHYVGHTLPIARREADELLDRLSVSLNTSTASKERT